MALIEYVGKKPMKEDNVAGTETVWAGPGDVQEIADPEAVAKLLAHAGIWRMAVEAPQPAKAEAKPEAKKPAPKKKGPKGKFDVEEDLPPLVNFDRLGKDKIEAYCRRNFGIEIDQRRSLQDIRAEAKALYARSAAGLRK